MLVMLVLMRYWRPTCWVRHWSPHSTATCKTNKDTHYLNIVSKSLRLSCLSVCAFAGQSVKTSSFQNIRTLILWGGATALLLRCDLACRRRPRAVTSTAWYSCTPRGQNWASRWTHTYRYRPHTYRVHIVHPLNSSFTNTYIQALKHTYRQWEIIQVRQQAHKHPVYYMNRYTHIGMYTHIHTGMFVCMSTGERGDGAPSCRSIGWQDIATHPGLLGSELVSLCFDDDQAPLCLAANTFLFSCVCAFVFSSKVDMQTTAGNTALHYSCLHNKSDCARLLLRARANIHISNNHTHTVFTECVSSAWFIDRLIRNEQIERFLSMTAATILIMP